MNIIEHILYTFGIFRSPGYEQVIDKALIPKLEEIAEQEQRTVDEVTTSLLANALERYVGDEEKQQVWDALTNREKEVAALACLGYANKQIASRLSISVPTVKTHMSNVFTKAGVKSREELQTLFDWDFSQWR